VSYFPELIQADWLPKKEHLIIIIIIIIRRQFLTRHNTAEVITRARINAEADDLSHSVSTHIS